MSGSSYKSTMDMTMDEFETYLAKILADNHTALLEENAKTTNNAKEKDSNELELEGTDDIKPSVGLSLPVILTVDELGGLKNQTKIVTEIPLYIIPWEQRFIERQKRLKKNPMDRSPGDTYYSL